MKIKDLCELYAGGDKPPIFSEIATDDCKIPVYANGTEKDGLVGFTNIAKYDKPCITVSGRGTIGFTVIRNEPFVPIVRLIVAIPKKTIELKYLKYAIEQIKFNSTGGTIPQLTVPVFGEHEILVVSHDEQKKIISEIEKYEKEIEKTKQIMDSCFARKQAILNKYLK